VPEQLNRWLVSIGSNNSEAYKKLKFLKFYDILRIEVEFLVSESLKLFFNLLQIFNWLSE